MAQQRAGPVQPLRLVLKEPRQVLGRRWRRMVAGAGTRGFAADAPKPFAVVRHSPRSHPDRYPAAEGGEPQNLAVDLQRLVLRKASEYANEGDLVGEAEPVVDSSALRNLSPVVYEEAAIADEAGPGDVGVGDRHDM